MRSERGAIAIMTGVGLVMMLALTAIAVDLGRAWSERRSVQSAADLAALAGALELANSGEPQAALDEVLLAVDENLGVSVPTADWLVGSCTDGNALASTAASLGLTPATTCVSFSADLTEVRVRIPTQSMDTSFAPVIGIDQLSVGASANAYGSSAHTTSLPFAVLDGFSAGDQACLRTSSNIDAGEMWTGNGPGVAPSAVAGSTDPCDSAALDASSEFMGTLDPPIWYDDAGNVICKSNEIAYLIAAGLDHDLLRFRDTPDPTTSPPWGTGGYGKPDSREVEDRCSPVPAVAPNTVKLQTGVQSSLLRCGLVTARSGNCATTVPGPSGTSPLPARLHQGDYVQSTHRIVGEAFDNTPLWNFLRPDIASADVPAACANVYTNRNHSGWDYYDKLDELTECLSDWKDNKYDFLFSESIIDSSRFLFAPLLAEDTLDDSVPNGGPTSCPSSSATKCVHFDDWVPIYIHTLYVSGAGSGSDCDPNNVGVARHQAGQQISCGANNKNIDAVSAMVLACGQMPPRICNPRTGQSPSYPGGDPGTLVGLTR